MNFNVITAAGLSQAQFGALVGVTRVTVNTWVKARFQPRLDIRDKVSRALALIAAAVDAGKLPVDETQHAKLVEARLQAISKALSKPGK